MQFIVRSNSSRLALAAVLVASASTFAVAQTPAAPAPHAEAGYTLRVFASSVTGKYTAPDSLAVMPGHIFVGFGDGNLPDGSDGKNTQVVEYNLAGKVEHIYTVPGHNDGLKVDPYTNQLWSLQNEDGNANVVIIDPEDKTQTKYSFQTPSPAGGGYDDVVFRQGKIYLSASNPANNPNLSPAIVEARVEGRSIAVKPVLEGNAQATDVVTGQTVTLNLQDPDSMTLDLAGDLVLTSQADAELVVVRKPGQASQSVLQIPLSSPYGAPMVDDTLFTPDADGFILIADKKANAIYELRRSGNIFTPGAAYSAAQGTNGTATVGFIGKLDPEFGILTPVVTGLVNPGGLLFVKTGPEDFAQELRERCNAFLSGK